jgi:nitrate reductase delta subunit
MFVPFKRSADRLAAAESVKRWTRSRFSLAENVMLLVTELESAVPGFPPLHTVVAFWTAEQKHYHFRIFKPLLDVLEEDLPPSWYKEALAVAFEGMQCDCC